jgi:hypothetical protein
MNLVKDLLANRVANCATKLLADHYNVLTTQIESREFGKALHLKYDVGS